ncbi:YdeI/OmpD-associated family protein [Tenacibaculum xiamenense]|uniref:YdeI/OmpD-associated family protein n=1 Tax=Tenacibaculum xiamenense TaxID=1261553 RepID=UPI0038964ADF
MIKETFYFKTQSEWRNWLSKNYDQSNGIYLIFYKVECEEPSMRWEEAVRVALCYGWIDSTVKSLGNGKRQQYFSPRKKKSVWSKLNKTYIEELIKEGLMHESGLSKINVAKEDGSWSSLDDVENLVVPEDLQTAFKNNKKAYENYTNFAPSYKKGYLYWLNQAKREQTRLNRITKIIELCALNQKSR